MKRLFSFLLKLLMARRSDRARDYTVMSLSDYSSPEGEPLEVLLDRLDHGTLEERRQAAYGLGKHRDAIVVPRLVELLSEADLHLQVYAIQGLRDIGDARAVLPLCQLLDRRQADELIASNVTRALAAIGDRRAVPTLVDALRSGDPFTRSDAAYALGEIGDPAALPHLELLKHDDVLPRRWHNDGGVSSAPAVNVSAEKAIVKIRGNLLEVEGNVAASEGHETGD